MIGGIHNEMGLSGLFNRTERLCWAGFGVEFRSFELSSSDPVPKPSSLARLSGQVHIEQEILLATSPEHRSIIMMIVLTLLQIAQCLNPREQLASLLPRTPL